jgi:DNA polymerase I-like protein with 3'-5' exonuclease and polymerase domains
MIIAGHKVEIADATDPIYNGFDCAATYQINDARVELRQNDDLIYRFERALMGVTMEMTLRGFLVDMEERERAIIELGNKRSNTWTNLSNIISAIGCNFTEKLPNSGKQLQHLFYDIMKLPQIKKTTMGETKLPMDRATLEKLELSDPFAAPIVNGILTHRDLGKSLQVLETEIDSDWRWRCSYNIAGTKTGRFSSSKSPFMIYNETDQAWRQTGNNFQNISEILRRVFIPDPGYKLYGIDKAQSEARDVGWFLGTVLGDWTYLNACESGDLHTYVTRLLYPEWAWTGDLKKDRAIAERRFYRFFTYRDASKRLGHATNYLGEPNEISRQTRIPLHLVQEFQDRYFAAFPIREMHQYIIAVLQTERNLTNSYGRRRDFFDRPTDRETWKSAIAYMFQSATADAVNLGLYRLWKYQGTEVQILSQLHDAIYFQYPFCSEREEFNMLEKALNNIQVTQHSRSGRTMTIPGEIVGGQNWAHRYRLLADGTKEDWNPAGLDGIRLQ